MKFLIILLINITLLLPAFAADGDYAISKIPASLLVNANAVKRFEDIRFEVVDLDKARYYRKVAYTILNEKGDKFATCIENYDKLQTVESIEGRLYDAAGKKIKSLRNSDVIDRSSSEGSLADDNRIKFHNFYYKVYPYTVEYEVELRFNYTLFYPGWVPLDNEHMSLEFGRISVIMPEGVSFRYKAFNYAQEPVVTNQKSSKTYTWELKNLAAVEIEYSSPGWFEITPAICMAPVEFSVQGYKGDMSSWQDFGKFVYALKVGRDQLPENIKKVVHELTDQVEDPRKKVAALYEFLQKNSRYISVQLGIGGWQPFDAKYVATNRYGDCKALTNYMYSLLKEAGVKSYYSLVKSGADKQFFINEFPSCSQFDHVILSVPLLKDTIWLECTDQTLPPGYLSGFTSDRYALMVDENGGTLVKTPRYSMADNLQVRKIKAEINADGQLAVDVSTIYKARQQDRLHSLINTYSKEKVSEHLKDEIDLPNYDVVSFNYKEDPSTLPTITEDLKITSNNYAQVTGKRLFICPNLLSKNHSKFSLDSTRKYDIDITFAYTDIDTVEIKIPAGYKPEAIPKNTQIVGSFGRYASSVVVSDNKIMYYRSMEKLPGRFPAKKYDELAGFYNQIYKADNSKLVFVKQE